MARRLMESGPAAASAVPASGAACMPASWRNFWHRLSRRQRIDGIERCGNHASKPARVLKVGGGHATGAIELAASIRRWPPVRVRPPLAPVDRVDFL